MHMKTIFLAVLACLAFQAAAQAQTFTFGIKGGASTSNISIEEVRNDPWQYREPEKITGYHAGIFSRLQVLGVFVQPEALLASSGGRIRAIGTTVGSPERTDEFRFTRLDVPILIGYNFFNFLRVQAGPVASMMLSARQDGNNIDDYLNETDWGLQGGVGLDILRFTLDLRYERINRNYTNQLQGNSFKMENEQYLLSVGYKLTR